MALSPRPWVPKSLGPASAGLGFPSNDSPPLLGGT